MAEEIRIRIARPEVGIEYLPDTRKAEPEDQLAACELALHALALRVQALRQGLHLPCPPVVRHVALSDLWQSGM